MSTILPCPFCGSSADHRGEAAYVRCTNLSCEAMGPSDDPTGSKWNAVPRGLPAPEWTGPDRWQAWCNLGTPDDVPVTPSFVAIGPWEPRGNAAVVTTNPEHITDIVRDWRRPLRRVQA